MLVRSKKQTRYKKNRKNIKKIEHQIRPILSSTPGAVEMAHDLVKIHGDLAEFLGDRRCGACQQGNRKCINQEDDDRCMLCNDAGRQCVFERSMMIKAPRTDFPWDALLCKETPRLVSGLVNHPMRYSRSSPLPKIKEKKNIQTEIRSHFPSN